VVAVSLGLGINFSKLNLKCYTDAGYSQPISSVPAGNLGEINLAQTSSATVIFFLQNPLSIPAGQKRYFELQASLTASGVNYSTTTILVGDSTGPLMGAFGEVNRLWPANFIWSPNSVFSSSSFADTDWVNGYIVPGLPSTGLIQSRVN